MGPAAQLLAPEQGAALVVDWDACWLDGTRIDELSQWRALVAAGLSKAAFLSEAYRDLVLSQAEKEEVGAQHEERAARARTACRALAAEQPERLADLLEGIRAALAALARLESSLSAHVTEDGIGVTFGHRYANDQNWRWLSMTLIPGQLGLMYALSVGSWSRML